LSFALTAGALFTPNTMLLHILPLLKNCCFNYLEQNWKSLTRHLSQNIVNYFSNSHLLHNIFKNIKYLWSHAHYIQGKKVKCSHDLLFCSLNILNHADILLFSFLDLPNRAHDLLFRFLDLLNRANNLLFRFLDLLNHVHDLIFCFLDL